MDDETRKTVETYNRTVEEYHEKIGNKEKALKAVDDFCKMLPKGAKVLDIGSGSGRDAKRLVENGMKVVGIDLAEKMVEFSRKLVPDAEFRIMGMRKLEFDDSTFDAVYASASLIHLKKKDVPKALKEIFRVLKPGGLLNLLVKEGEGECMVKDKRYGGAEKYLSYFSKEEIEKLVKKSGFRNLETIVRVEDVSYDTTAFIRITCRKS